jgi:hypothetical protein
MVVFAGSMIGECQSIPLGAFPLFADTDPLSANVAGQLLGVGGRPTGPSGPQQSFVILSVIQRTLLQRPHHPHQIASHLL